MGCPVLLETETHPRISLKNRHLERANLGREKSVRMDLSVFYKCRGVAQPGSAPALGAGGQRFKSSRPDHFSNQLIVQEVAN